MSTTPKTRVLLLNSYCGGEDCSDEMPCYECLKMCNVAWAELEPAHIIGGLEYLHTSPDARPAIRDREIAQEQRVLTVAALPNAKKRPPSSPPPASGPA